MDEAALRRVVQRVIEEAADRDLHPLIGGGTPRPGGLMPVRMPERLSISAKCLDALCVLAGWSSLVAAFQELDDGALPLLHVGH